MHNFLAQNLEILFAFYLRYPNPVCILKFDLEVVCVCLFFCRYVVCFWCLPLLPVVDDGGDAEHA